MQADFLKTEHLLVSISTDGCILELFDKTFHVVFASWMVFFLVIFSMISMDLGLAITIEKRVIVEPKNVPNSVWRRWKSLDRGSAVSRIREKLLRVAACMIFRVHILGRVACRIRHMHRRMLMLRHITAVVATLHEIWNLLHRIRVLVWERLLFLTAIGEDFLKVMLVLDALVHHSEVLLVRACWIRLVLLNIWFVLRACIITYVCLAIAWKVVLLVFQNRRQIGVSVDQRTHLLWWKESCAVIVVAVQVVVASHERLFGVLGRSTLVANLCKHINQTQISRLYQFQRCFISNDWNSLPIFALLYKPGKHGQSLNWLTLIDCLASSAFRLPDLP